MNYDRVPNSLKWMLTTSFFHAGYEALLVNELRYLQLVERKFGLDIQVPSATSKLIHPPPPLLSSFLPPFLSKEADLYNSCFTVLSSFGFHAQAFWWPDIALMAIVFGSFTMLSYLVLEFWVKERR